MKFAKWIITGYERNAAVALNRCGINPLVAVFLASRGYRTYESACAILENDLSLLIDPFLMRDMDKAVTRIRRAIQSRERVAIYGDYDVDGMTASCLLATYFRAQGIEFEIYIPERTEEGYGVNTAALDTLKSRGVSLVITVDSGITAVDESKYAREIGLDLIITDHHECKPVLPDAVAIINPKRRDCPYPNKGLSGVGVAFKLVCALERHKPIDTLFDQYGDFVAMGTIADVMPVLGENRILIRRGLAALNRKRRPGLRSLIKESCIDRREITVAIIGFILAPRLNAAGRMGRTSLTIDLLLTDDDNEATALTQELCSLNMERKQVESAIFEEAQAHLMKNLPKGPIVLAGRGWFQGVMGIVAARITEQFLFPSVVISIDEEGVGRGSCRSFSGFRIYSALEKCSDLLVNFGGHEMAAGITILEENIDAFRERLNKLYHEEIKIPPVPTLLVDFEVIKPELLSLENVTALERTEPYGNGLVPPFLCMRDVLLSSVVPVGGGRHTKLRVTKSGRTFDCIAFNWTVEDLGAKEGDRVDIAFEPQVNEFRSWRNVQLNILDIRPYSE
jgi:single-stranded-DNA-specific exonuclease